MMKENGIGIMEMKIIAIISSYSPVDTNEVHNIYSKVKSFDKTIEIIEMSMKLNISTYDILEAIR